ncbi:hypothetical protein QCA50_010631 [Cerrena zonata]|uniref:Uncharacterized protein n=1 Tax=Cerrena zonata TaxID=2478898 RepID=A0AAW0G1Z5_9APHY
MPSNKSESSASRAVRVPKRPHASDSLPPSSIHFKEGVKEENESDVGPPKKKTKTGRPVNKIPKSKLPSKERIDRYAKSLRKALEDSRLPADKRKTWKDTTLDRDILVRYKDTARWAARVISPFLVVSYSFPLALRISKSDEHGLCELTKEAEERADEFTRDQALRLYGLMKWRLPQFMEFLPTFQTSTEMKDLFFDILDFMTTKVMSARSCDVGVLRYESMHYLVPYRDYNAPSPSYGRKHQRGFVNIVTGRMLCPQNKLDDFDQNPEEFCLAARNGDIEVSAEDLPSYLYDQDDCNPQDILKGLLRGPFLVKCFRHVFTGKQSACKTSNGPSDSTRSLAKSNRMACVQSYHIVYVGILARFLLNSQKTWKTEDEKFDMTEYHNVLLELFAENKTWAEETLEWWNRRVFSIKPKGSYDGHESAFSLIMKRFAGADANHDPASKPL